MDQLWQTLNAKAQRGEPFTPNEIQVLQMMSANNNQYKILSGFAGGMNMQNPFDTIAHAVAANAVGGLQPIGNQNAPQLASINVSNAPSPVNAAPAGSAPVGKQIQPVDSSDSSDRYHFSVAPGSDPYARLNLEKTRTMMMPKSSKVNVEALVRYQLDQIELNQRKREFFNLMDDLQVQSDFRFYTAVGLMNPPLNSFPGGYDGKSGKRSATELEFENEIFSTRYAYYENAGKKDPSRVVLAQVIPKTSEEQAEAIRILQASRASRSNGGTSGSGLRPAKKTRSNSASPAK